MGEQIDFGKVFSGVHDGWKRISITGGAYVKQLDGSGWYDAKIIWSYVHKKFIVYITDHRDRGDNFREVKFEVSLNKDGVLDFQAIDAMIDLVRF